MAGPEEGQQLHRDELRAQLFDRPDNRLRLWYFDENRRAHQLEFLDVKFEDDEIIVEMAKKL